jgi:hypothetical protein
MDVREKRHTDRTKKEIEMFLAGGDEERQVVCDKGDHVGHNKKGEE